MNAIHTSRTKAKKKPAPTFAARNHVEAVLTAELTRLKAPPAAPPPPGAGLLVDLENTTPWVKLGLQGFAKSGKSYTAVEVAIGLHRRMKSTKPLGFFDTEAAAVFAIPRLVQAGTKAVVARSRSLADFAEFIRAGEAGAFDVAVIDSVSHLWEDLVAAYKRKQNVEDLGPTGWVALNSAWHTAFSRPFVDSPLHLIFTGRAAHDYATVVDADGNAESVKSGTKMRAEGQTAFEPSILIEMERIELQEGDSTRVVRRATVLGDRTGVCDGAVVDNPTFESFTGAIDVILAGAVAARDPVEQASACDLFADRTQHREVSRLLADIRNELGRAWSALTMPGKQKRAAALVGSFGTATWERIESLGADDLTQGLACLRQVIADGGPIITIPLQPPVTVLQSIRDTLAGDAAGVDTVARTRALIAARGLASALPEPFRGEADELIQAANRRWFGSGGTQGSGGVRRGQR